ncbi:MAG: hypothetical protein V3V08_03360 [Nannocystaceae bacterium]
MHPRLVRATALAAFALVPCACEALGLNQGPESTCTYETIEAPNDALRTEEGSIDYETVEVSLNHRQAGSGAGCLNAVELVFRQANHAGCTLTVEAANELTEDGYLKLSSVRMRASESCPGYPKHVEGSYIEGELDGGVEMLGIAEGEQFGCYNAGLVVHLSGTLELAAGPDDAVEELGIKRTKIAVVGRMTSIGDDTECPDD